MNFQNILSIMLMCSKSISYKLYLDSIPPPKKKAVFLIFMCFRNLTGRVFLKRRVKGIFGKIIQSILKNKLKKKKSSRYPRKKAKRHSDHSTYFQEFSSCFEPHWRLCWSYQQAHECRCFRASGRETNSSFKSRHLQNLYLNTSNLSRSLNWDSVLCYLFF